METKRILYAILQPILGAAAFFAVLFGIVQCDNYVHREEWAEITAIRENAARMDRETEEILEADDRWLEAYDEREFDKKHARTWAEIDSQNKAYEERKKSNERD